MGRQPCRPHDQKNNHGFVDRDVSEKIQTRLGLDKQVCTSCSAGNPPAADKCRKCGHTQLRQRKSSFSDE